MVYGVKDLWKSQSLKLGMKYYSGSLSENKCGDSKDDKLPRVIGGEIERDCIWQSS